MEEPTTVTVRPLTLRDQYRLIDLLGESVDDPKELLDAVFDAKGAEREKVILAHMKELLAQFLGERREVWLTYLASLCDMTLEEFYDAPPLSEYEIVKQVQARPEFANFFKALRELYATKPRKRSRKR